MDVAHGTHCVRIPACSSGFTRLWPKRPMARRSLRSGPGRSCNRWGHDGSLRRNATRSGSYGGHIAARVALTAPHRVLSLTLIEPAMHYLLAETGENQAYAEISSVAASVLALIKSGEPEQAAAIFLDYWVAPGVLAAMPSERRAAIVGTMRKLAYEWPFSLARNDAPISEWRRLALPTLLISGENTTFALRRLMALLRNAMTPCDFISIAGAGHMCPVTHPDQVNAAIRKHIERHRRPPWHK